MARPIEQTFRSEPLRELTQQLSYASIKQRHQQIRKAEKLHDEIEPDSNYSLEFIKFRITGYRDENATDTVIVGEALLPDLRLLIDQVSKSSPLPVKSTDDSTKSKSKRNDIVERPDELAARLNVSTKTIARWRKKGMRWRWVHFENDRHHKLVIPRVASDLFCKREQSTIKRAATFSQIPQKQKANLIARAKRIAQAVDTTPFQLATHLAKKTGRAVETLRQLLDHHDRDNPTDLIFANRTHPLTDEQKREIGHAYRLGTPMRELNQRFNRTRSTILRAVHEQRVDAIRRMKFTFIESPTFTRDDADEVLLRPEPLAILAESKSRHTSQDDLPQPLRILHSREPIDSDHLRALLTRMNYLKFKADALRKALDPYEPRVRDLDAIEENLERAQHLKDELVALNMPQVLSVARRHLVRFESESKRMGVLFRVLENSLPILIDAIDTYDIRRNQTFEEYVSWRIMRSLAIENVAAQVESAKAIKLGRAKAKDKSNDALNTAAQLLVEKLTLIAARQGVELESDSI